MLNANKFLPSREAKVVNLLMKIPVTVTTNTAGYYSEVFFKTCSGLQMLEHRTELWSLACCSSSLGAGLTFGVFCIYVLEALSVYISFLFSALIRLPEEPIRVISLTDEPPPILHADWAKKTLTGADQCQRSSTLSRAHGLSLPALTMPDSRPSAWCVVVSNTNTPWQIYFFVLDCSDTVHRL